MKHVLVVCTGNICRSPLAEAMLRHLAREAGLPLEVSSAGTLGLVGEPANPNTCRAALEIGIDLSKHRSRALDLDVLKASDHVLVMEENHAADVADFGLHLPVQLLGPFAGVREIPDPIGRWMPKHRQVRRLLDTALRNWLRTQAG